MGETPQIFLSYVRKDENEVRKLYQFLVAAGFRPWMDTHDVLGGEPWRQKIRQAIKESDFFLACLSHHSVNKRGYVQREIKDALDIFQEKLPDDIFLIPVRLEECKVPESLGELQWVDLYVSDGQERLLKAIQVGLERRNRERRQNDRRAGDRRASNRRREAPWPAPAVRGEGGPEEARPEASVDPADTPRQPPGVELPIVTFPRALTDFIRRVAPEVWETLDAETRRFITTIGTKLEPIVQIIPQPPVPLVRGFEGLAIGSLGESFAQICLRAAGLDPGLLRLLMTLAAMQTISLLRESAARAGTTGGRHLLFSINLDPEMLDCPHIEALLDTYQDIWETNVIFEVNEKTTLAYLNRLLDLQVDFKLRYCADDFNRWLPEVKQALRNRVEMSKVDNASFLAAMAVRGDDPKEAIRRIAEHRIQGKPLIVEGVENRNHLRFLERHWPHDKLGHLYGQGYILSPGPPWEKWTTDLRDYDLPGGHIVPGHAVAREPER